MPDDLADTQSKVDDLQAALRDMDQLVKHMRSQRDVARSQCEQLHRHWRQQVELIERRLSKSQQECEQLRRELDSATRSAQPMVLQPAPGTQTLRDAAQASASESLSLSSAPPGRLPSLPHLIHRLQRRAAF
jgi:uncharacterized coiled-coil DUF342 family protein